MNKNNKIIQELSDKIDFLENILAKIPGHIYWKDLDGKFLGCNDQQAISAGFKSRMDLIGKTDFEMPWKDKASKLRQVDKNVVQSQKTFVIEEESKLSSGKNAVFLSSKTPLLDQNETVVGVLGISIDITRQKELEKELKIAKEKTEFESRHKSQFIEDMQHDIRTPASGVWSVLDMMVKQENDPAKKKILQMAEAASKKLLSICNNVIAFEQAQQGAIPVLLAPISIREFIAELMALDGAAAYHKMIDLKWHVDPDVPSELIVDKYRLEKILMNLLGNALKFTPEGGVVGLNVHKVRDEKNKTVFEFEVKDTGIGFDDKEKEHIFEKFVRLNRANAGIYEGSGLGLSMVKRFVTDLKGEISVTSQLGQGSVFSIHLPLAVGETKAVSTQPVQDSLPENTPLRILFIEDDPIAKMIGEEMLKDMGYTVDSAMTVHEAKEFLLHQPYQFVLSDIGLPDGKGMDILNWLKSHASHLNAHAPFVALTAHSATVTIQEALDCGFIEVLNKPFPADKVRELIKQYSLPVHAHEPGVVEMDTLEVPLDGLPCPLSDIIDLDAILKACMGDILMLKKAVRMLGELLPQDLLELEKLCSMNDIEQTRKLLHRLYGALNYCSVPRLRKAATTLHEAVKQTDSLPSLKPLYDNLFHELDIFMLAFEKLKQYERI